MAELKFSPQAKADLKAIRKYFENVYPDFADVFEAGVKAKTEFLERFPAMGRIVPEIGVPSIREVIFRDYRIVYFLDSDEERVSVLTIFRSSRPLGSLDKPEEAGTK